MLPKIWEGQTVFILGGGPSLNDVDLNLIKDRRVIGVNNAYGYPVIEEGKTVRYEVRDWVDLCWFSDSGWFNNHRKYLELFPGLIAHCNPSIGKVDRAGIS